MMMCSKVWREVLGGGGGDMRQVPGDGGGDMGEAWEPVNDHYTTVDSTELYISPWSADALQQVGGTNSTTASPSQLEILLTAT